MNILVCSHSWVTDTSGLGNVIKNLCDYLRGRGHTVIILLPGATEVMQEIRKWGCEANELNLRPPIIEGHAVKSRVSFALFLPAVLFQLARLLRTRSIHIVNVHYPGDSLVYAAICRKLLSGRFGLITSIHGADLFPDGRARPQYSLAIRSLLEGSDEGGSASGSMTRVLTQFAVERLGSSGADAIYVLSYDAASEDALRLHLGRCFERCVGGTGSPPGGRAGAARDPGEHSFTGERFDRSLGCFSRQGRAPQRSHPAFAARSPHHSGRSRECGAIPV